MSNKIAEIIVLDGDDDCFEDNVNSFKVDDLLNCNLKDKLIKYDKNNSKENDKIGYDINIINDEWACMKCTLLNNFLSSKCAACLSSNPSSKSLDSKSVENNKRIKNCDINNQNSLLIDTLISEENHNHKKKSNYYGFFDKRVNKRQSDNKSLLECDISEVNKKYNNNSKFNNNKEVNRSIIENKIDSSLNDINDDKISEDSDTDFYFNTNKKNSSKRKSINKSNSKNLNKIDNDYDCINDKRNSKSSGIFTKATKSLDNFKDDILDFDSNDSYDEIHLHEKYCRISSKNDNKSKINNLTSKKRKSRISIDDNMKDFIVDDDSEVSNDNYEHYSNNLSLKKKTVKSKSKYNEDEEDDESYNDDDDLKDFIVDDVEYGNSDDNDYYSDNNSDSNENEYDDDDDEDDDDDISEINNDNSELYQELLNHSKRFSSYTKTTDEIPPTYPNLSDHFWSVATLNQFNICSINFNDFMLKSDSNQKLQDNYNHRKNKRNNKIENKKQKKQNIDKSLSNKKRRKSNDSSDKPKKFYYGKFRYKKK